MSEILNTDGFKCDLELFKEVIEMWGISSDAKEVKIPGLKMQDICAEYMAMKHFIDNLQTDEVSVSVLQIFSNAGLCKILNKVNNEIMRRVEENLRNCTL